jgi:uncharacterized protein (TIGR02453 family)
MKYFDENYRSFFLDLSANNHKDWFNKNRERYDNYVNAPFNRFVTDLLKEINQTDSEIPVNPEQMIFRINKDLRFSKEKSPYKLYRSALISSEGRKSKEIPSFYIELSYDYIKLAGGCYKLKSSTLQNLESNLEQAPTHNGFSTYFGEFEVDYKAKSCIYESYLNPLLLFEPELLNIVFNYWQSAKPVNDFLKQL